MSTAVSILLIEDSQTQALEFSATLEQQGYEVHWATSAEEAMTVVEEGRPDLVIVDYLLPGMRGDEFSRRLRLDPATRSIPVLMMTESADESIEAAGLRSGIDGYVRKDEADAVILWRIEALLRRPQPRDPLKHEKKKSGALRLLVVEDSPTWREAIVSLLETSGYEIVTADSANTALTLMQKERFDGVIIDLHLPDMDGFELSRKIREMDDGRSNGCILVAMTFSPDSAVSARLLECGADEVIDKARRAEIITARIEALMRRKLMLDEQLQLREEFREHEIRLLHAEAERRAAEARAELADELKRKNEELTSAYAQLQQAQSELVHNAKMASLGQLVAGVAHEINNPLGFVMSNLDVIRRALTAADEDGTSQGSSALVQKARSRVDSMDEGLKRIHELVLNLRSFSRLDEGLHKRVNLHECIDATIRLLDHRLRGGITITRDYTATPTLDCQPGPLNQVWMNLLSNAIDAVGSADGGGLVTVRTRDEGNELVVEIGDNGTGMSEETKARIFEPFFTTKSQGEGTGLGLSTSYGVVEAHHGELSVVSTLGKGACFTVRLPRNDMQAEDCS